MPLSQFDETLRVSETAQFIAGGPVRLKVGGPLTLDPGTQYRPPFAVHFSIVQSVEGEDRATRERANRVSGVAIVEDVNGRWDEDIEIDPEVFRSGDARGIAMAILEREGEFCYETITWCDHIKLDLGTASAP